jgi:predicted aspartyl protease
MALSRRLVSQAFPFLPITLTVQGHTATLLALLDTGFDGDVVVPRGFFPPNVAPDHASRWALADGSRVLAPSYSGTAQIGQFAPFKVTVIALGTESLIGLGAIGGVAITLDHGQRLIVEQ